MNEYPFGDRMRRPRPRRRRRVLKGLAALVVLAAAFVVGVALGKALGDGPKAGGTVTYVRTLEPLPQRPAG
jgi:ferric-dicitrate binding protein FerR (iron transport regulator)